MIAPPIIYNFWCIFLIHWNTTSGLENIKKSVTPHTLNHYVLVGTYVFSEKFRNIRWNTTCVLGKQLLGNRSKNDWVQKNVVIWDMSVRSGQERITDLIICRMSIFPYYKFCHICVFSSSSYFVFLTFCYLLLSET